ncbi:MAG: hypothetical protein RIT14_2642 [Pseudomonadota bacterium]|jgi:hypothetical protein
MRNAPVRNIFVLCTGRCGSTTFARAAAHIRGWTAGHETRAHLIGPDRLAYPPDHIEADNRLSWMLGRLDRRFGKDAAYVHLTRAPEEVARSYARRARYGIMHAYYHGIVFPAPADVIRDRRPLLPHAQDMVETITANITHFLRDKPHVLPMRLEQIETDFPAFWSWIGAEGDLDSALQEWSIRHNESAPAGPSRGIIGRALSWPKQQGASRSSPGPRAD